MAITVMWLDHRSMGWSTPKLRSMNLRAIFTTNHIMSMMLITMRLLRVLADKLDQDYGLEGNRLYYLAMSPSFFGTICEHLKSQGLTKTTGYNRVIIENHLVMTMLVLKN